MVAALVTLAAVTGGIVTGGVVLHVTGVGRTAGPWEAGPPVTWGIVGRPEPERVPASIVASTTWETGHVYRLDGLVFVERGANLVVEPGVTVLGSPGSALVVTRGATMHARGTASEPIVFTSAKPVGQRASGDWGGVMVLGDAPLNHGQATVEGVPAGDMRGAFGGERRRSNCGALEYVRIEFAGAALGSGKEVSGLTLGGCGTETLVHHLQVHRGHGDGVAILGGMVDLKHVFVSHARDDALHWGMGWSGRAQFLIVVQHPEMGGNGFEGDGAPRRPDAPPISGPRIYNVTMVGSRNQALAQRAMVVGEGSGGDFRNFLISGYGLEPIDLRGDDTGERIASKALSFGSIAMLDTDPGGRSWFSDESGESDDDGGFDERRYFIESAPDIVLDAPPALGPQAWDAKDPRFTPVAPYIGAGSQWSPPADELFWDKGASYYGAMRYGEPERWTRGWTACPQS